MRATGIIRRIDDLGRVVIPREIRMTMQIKEGDPLEIFTDKDGVIILKKCVIEDACVFCGEITTEEMLDKPVCGSCKEKIK